MTQNKDFKRIVRRRMEKTGESYTAARAKLLAQRRNRSDQELAARAGVSHSAVMRATDRSWTDWVELLDAAGAASMPHRDIAELAHAEDGVSPWWAQQVTVGYERIKGLRDHGQRRGGSYDANKSRTYKVEVERLYRAFAHKRHRERWLADAPWQVRTQTANRSIRLDWSDGERVQLYFASKPTARDGLPRASVQVQHGGLESKAAVERARQAWGERLDALGAHLLD